MSAISTFLEKIKTAVFGEEVRGAIHDSIQQCYVDVTAAKTLADNAAKSVTKLKTQADGLRKELIQSDGLNIAAAYGDFAPKSLNGITFSWNDDHTECTVNGTADARSFKNIITSQAVLPHGIQANSKIYIDVNSTAPENAYIAIYYYKNSVDTYWGNPVHVNSPSWIKIPDGVTGIIIRVEVAANTTVANDVVSVRIYKNLPNSLQYQYFSGEIEKRIYSKSTDPYRVDNSLTLGDIREDGYYVIDISLTVTDAPAGFAPTALKVENFSATKYGTAFIKQTVEDVLGRSDKRYYRYSNKDGVFGEWKEEAAPVTNEYSNNYTINQYTSNNTINCEPAITTDTNNFLAAPNDGKDMTGAIQAMLDTTGICHLGPGVFYTTGINIPTRGMLAGSGNKTKLVLADSVVSGYAVKINTHGCIKDLMIGGTEAPSTAIALSEIVGERHGILFQGEASTGGKVPYRSTIHNVAIYNFSGGGITCTDTGYSIASCLNVSDVYIFWCGAGINIPYWSEYNRFTNVNVDGCYYGCINNGGNNVFANCSFSGNTVGVLMDNSTGQSKNNSHGTYTGCVFNHSGKNTGVAIKLLGITNGELFNACQLFFGKIVIDGCVGVRLSCFNVGRQTPISISNSKGIFLNGWMLHSASETPVTKDDSVVIVSNCYTRTGTPFTI